MSDAGTVVIIFLGAVSMIICAAHVGQACSMLRYVTQDRTNRPRGEKKLEKRRCLIHAGVYALMMISLGFFLYHYITRLT